MNKLIIVLTVSLDGPVLDSILESHLTVTCVSFKHEKAHNSRHKPVLCLHIADNLAKNQFYIISSSTLLLPACHKQPQFVSFALIESMKNAKDNKV